MSLVAQIPLPSHLTSLLAPVSCLLRGPKPSDAVQDPLSPHPRPRASALPKPSWTPQAASPQGSLVRVNVRPLLGHFS